MGRTIYAISLTFVWLVLLTIRPHHTMAPALLIPGISILGAWLAAAGNRTGCVAFAATSIVLTFFLGFLAMAMLAAAAMYFVGGQAQMIALSLGTAAILISTAVIQFIGIGILKPASPVTQL